LSRPGSAPAEGVGRAIPESLPIVQPVGRGILPPRPTRC
jgi:hypothetical protein